jgi:hypothetical protein
MPYHAVKSKSERPKVLTEKAAELKAGSASKKKHVFVSRKEEEQQCVHLASTSIL